MRSIELFPASVPKIHHFFLNSKGILRVVHPENGVERRHAEVCHMSTIADKRVDSVMDGF